MTKNLRRRNMVQDGQESAEDINSCNDSELDKLLHDYNKSIPLARRKAPDGWFTASLQVGLLVSVLCTGFYIVYYFEHFHVNLTHAYAHLGHAESQHQIAQRYLQGRGVDHNQSAALYWFQKAAEQGHPLASYNLAAAHMQGIHDMGDTRDIYKAIRQAADQGIPEAKKALLKFCHENPCAAAESATMRQ